MLEGESFDFYKDNIPTKKTSVLSIKPSLEFWIQAWHWTQKVIATKPGYPRNNLQYHQTLLFFYNTVGMPDENIAKTLDIKMVAKITFNVNVLKPNDKVNELKSNDKDHVQPSHWPNE